MSFEIIAGGKFPIKAWTKGVQVEDEAKKQLINIASMPFIHKHVAVMPDVHLGKGATVGSVIATKGAVIPAAVGVDIGCGMMAVRTSLNASDLPYNLSKLRSKIEELIPHGRTDNGGPNDKGSWLDAPKVYIGAYQPIAQGLDDICAKHPKLSKSASRATKHLGTLGTGNHFVEICLDENQNVWVMLHSGSRGIGNAIGSYFIELAKEDMRRWFINLPDIDLAYIPQGSVLFKDYLLAMEWAQQYAALNRGLMMDAVMNALYEVVNDDFIPELQVVSCHHNYVAWERHFGENVIVTRKGAVSAQQGQLGIIPANMGMKSYIVEGRGNRESFCSCSHGAGRLMSRNEAKKRFTLEDHIAATQGVECRKDIGVLDETPKAYKDIDAVMAAQMDLVDIRYTLKQILCVKG